MKSNSGRCLTNHEAVLSFSDGFCRYVDEGFRGLHGIVDFLVGGILFRHYSVSSTYNIRHRFVPVYPAFSERCLHFSAFRYSMGCSWCLWNFRSSVLHFVPVGNLLRLILGAIWYVFCALVFLAVSGGYLPGKLPAAFVFAIAFFVRLFAFDLGVISGQAWILEGSTLCAIASLMFLPLAMVVPKPKEE